jgi:hypothetical protein
LADLVNALDWIEIKIKNYHYWLSDEIQE